MIKKRLSQVFTALQKGFTLDTFEGKFPVYQEIGVPAALSNTAVLAATTLADGETTTVTAGITNPDVYRNVIVKGNASGITGTVIINGTDWAGRDITEYITANGSSAVLGVKAFKTIKDIILPARNAGENTISIGVGNAFGLCRDIEVSDDVVSVYVDGVREAADSVSTANSTVTVTTVPNATRRYHISFLTIYF